MSFFHNIYKQEAPKTARKPLFHLDDSVVLLTNELLDLESGDKVKIDSHQWVGKIKGYSMREGTMYWFVTGKDGSTGFVQNGHVKLLPAKSANKF